MTRCARSPSPTSSAAPSSARRGRGRWRSPALGADEVLTAHPDHRGARDLLIDAVEVIVGDRRSNATWPWPEPRLTYANAVLPDAMIAAGVALDRPTLVDDGLELLEWLLETRDC